MAGMLHSTAIPATLLERRNRQNHLRMDPRQFADVAVRWLVLLSFPRILTLDLHGTYELVPAAGILCDEEIETSSRCGK